MRTCVALLLTLCAAPAVRADGDPPLTLARVLALARSTAPAVDVADAQVQVADARVDRARAAQLPSVGLSSSLSPGVQMTVPVYPSTSDRAALCSAGNLACSAGTQPVGSMRASLGVDARWRLLDFGATQAAVEARGIARDATAVRLEALRVRTAATAVAQWLQVLADAERVAVRTTLAEGRLRQAEVVRSRVAAGDTSPTDLIQVEVAADGAALDVATATAALHADRIPLLATLGLPPDSSVPVEGTLDVTLMQAAAEDGTNHPDLRAAALDARAAARDADAAHATVFPTLDGTAAASTAGIGTTAPTVNVTPQAGVGLALAWPLFDPGLQAERALADANHTVAVRTQHAEQVRVAGEQARATTRLVEQRNVLLRATRYRTSARAALEAVEGRTAAGAARVAELLEAQAQVAQAEATLIDARLAAALAALDVALAHGVVDDSSLVQAPQ